MMEATWEYVWTCPACGREYVSCHAAPEAAWCNCGPGHATAAAEDFVYRGQRMVAEDGTVLCDLR